MTTSPEQGNVTSAALWPSLLLMKFARSTLLVVAATIGCTGRDGKDEGQLFQQIVARTEAFEQRLSEPNDDGTIEEYMRLVHELIRKEDPKKFRASLYNYGNWQEQYAATIILVESGGTIDDAKAFRAIISKSNDKVARNALVMLPAADCGVTLEAARDVVTADKRPEVVADALASINCDPKRKFELVPLIKKRLSNLRKQPEENRKLVKAIHDQSFRTLKLRL